MNTYAEQLLPVLVFKTDIRGKKDLKRVASVLDGHHHIVRWNVDRKDVDKVLRVESQVLLPTCIIDLITSAGYHCEELPD